ncbi:hypothetical protein ACFQ4Q_01845 [Lysobacter gummosus]|uniref:hypothetical protein n=1 Tax=Lysobacter gummosus TaxID=262324 RepID=UPI0036254E0C
MTSGTARFFALALASLPLAAQAQLIAFDFTGTGESYSDTQAVEEAIDNAKRNGYSAGYYDCVVKQYTYYPDTSTTWVASAWVTCYKDTTRPPTQPPGPAPAPPTIYAPVRDGVNHIVRWSTPAPGRYALEQSVNGGGWKERYKGSQTSWTAVAPLPGQYRYRVMLITSTHNIYSGTVGIDVTAQPPVPPPTMPDEVGPNHEILWQAVAGAEWYELDRAGEDGAWTTVYAGAAMQWSVVGSPAGLYRYRVKACSNGGCSAASAERLLRVVIDVSAVADYLLSH